MPFQLYASQLFDVNGQNRLAMPMPAQLAGAPTTNDLAPIGCLAINPAAETIYMNVNNIGTNVWKELATTDDVPGTTASVTTNNAVQTTLYSYTLADNSAVNIEAQVIASPTGYATGLGGNINVTVIKGAGAPDIVGAIGGTITNSMGGTSAINVIIAGNAVEIVVTGIAATTIKWQTFITQTVISG